MRCIQEEIVILEIIIIVYSFELANKQKGKNPLRHVQMRKSLGAIFCANYYNQKIKIFSANNWQSFKFLRWSTHCFLSVLKQSKNINKSCTNMFCRQSTYCLIWMICLVLWFHIAIQFIKYVYSIFLVHCSLLLFLVFFYQNPRLNVNLNENEYIHYNNGYKKKRNAKNFCRLSYAITSLHTEMKWNQQLKEQRKILFLVSLFCIFFSIFLHC